MGCVEATANDNINRDDMEEYTNTFKKRPRAMYLEPIDTDRKNLYVVNVNQYSIAGRAGVTVGSRVIAVNGKSVQGKRTNTILNKIANSSLPLSITFIRPKTIIIDQKPKSYDPFKLSKILELTFYIQTPPILKGNQVILMHTNIETKQTKYCMIDLNKQQIIKDAVDIKCDPTFDVFNTVYTLDEKNNTVYFVENNKNILRWNLNDNHIVSLNKSITTTYDNYANIICVNDEIHILGAESPSDKDDNYFFIPYSTANKIIKSRNKTVYRIKFTGQFARMMTVKYDGLQYILIIGGQLKNHEEIIYPSPSLWKYAVVAQSRTIICKCINSFVNYGIVIPAAITSLIYEFYCIRDYDQTCIFNESGEVELSKWNKCQMCVPRMMNSFGVINYKNRYLFLFGGKVIFGKRKLYETTNKIFALAMQDNEYNLEKVMWYELNRKLSKKDCFHAVYNGGKMVHLFGYSGNYYTMNIQDLLDDWQAGECRMYTRWDVVAKSHGLYFGEPFPVQNMGVKTDVDLSV